MLSRKRSNQKGEESSLASGCRVSRSCVSGDGAAAEGNDGGKKWVGEGR